MFVSTSWISIPIIISSELCEEEYRSIFVVGRECIYFVYVLCTIHIIINQHDMYRDIFSDDKHVDSFHFYAVWMSLTTESTHTFVH